MENSTLNHTETPLSERHSEIPWYRKPSPNWLLPTFFAITITWSLALAPAIKLNVKIVCYHYYASKSIYVTTEEDCKSADVQALVSSLMAALNLCSAIPAIFRAGPLGSLSDRQGRRMVILLPTAGATLSSVVTILVGTYYKHLSLGFLVISPLIDGFSGGFLPVLAAIYAYATDCTPPELRSVVFSRIQAAVFLGFSIGPLLGGLIVDQTDNLLSVFYVNLSIYVTFCLFVIFILPESLSKEIRAKNVKRQKEIKSALKRRHKGFVWLWHVIDMFKPLALFFPRNIHRRTVGNNVNETTRCLDDERKLTMLTRDTLAGKYSLLILACLHCVVTAAFMGSQTIFFLYTAKVFDWTVAEQGYYFFMMGAIRFSILIFIMPFIAKFFKSNKDLGSVSISGPVAAIDSNEPAFSTECDEQKVKRLTNFEVWCIRIGLLIEGMAFVGFARATSSAMFAAATAFVSFGGIVSPVLKSIFSKLVPASQIGELLGGLDLLEAVLRIIAPSTFDMLYSALVRGDSLPLIWYCFSGILIFGVLVTFLFGPKLKCDKVRLPDVDIDDDNHDHNN